MKKMAFGLLLLIISIIGITKNVYASENVFYTTPNGIELTEEEYKFLTTFFWKEYPDIMTEEQYQDFVSRDLLTKQLKIKKVEIPDSPFGTPTRSPSHSDPAKTLQIGSICSTTCYTSLVATWTASPFTRSYDVIGAYFSGNALSSHQATYVYSDATGAISYSNLKTATNGIGNSVKLPSVGENIIVNILFNATPNGTIFGSYQHAMQDVTLPVSQEYNFSLGGYGNVFDFYGNAAGKYDHMAGVDITV